MISLGEFSKLGYGLVSINNNRLIARSKPFIVSWAVIEKCLCYIVLLQHNTILCCTTLYYNIQYNTTEVHVNMVSYGDVRFSLAASLAGVQTRKLQPGLSSPSTSAPMSVLPHNTTLLLAPQAMVRWCKKWFLFCCCNQLCRTSIKSSKRWR